MAVSEEEIDISERYLLGDLIAFVVDAIKAQQVPWGALPESEQREIIDRATRRCKAAVRQVVNIIASSGRPTAQAEIASVAFGDSGIKVGLKVARSQTARHELADSIGSTVLVLLPEYARHENGDAPKADPDQARLEGLDPHPGPET